MNLCMFWYSLPSKKISLKPYLPSRSKPLSQVTVPPGIRRLAIGQFMAMDTFASPDSGTVSNDPQATFV